MNPSTRPDAASGDLLQQGIALHQAGKLDLAEQRYREVIALAPQQGDANHNLGVLLRETGRLAQALPCLEASWRAQPDNRQYLISYSGALLDASDALQAAEVLDAALARGVDDNGLRCNRGNAARALYRPDEAQAHFRTVLARDPGNALANYNLAGLMQELGKLEDAAAGYRAVLAVAPRFAQAQNNLGVVLHALGRTDEAIAVFLALLQGWPDYADAYENLADALAAQHRNAEALQCYLQAAERNIQSSTALHRAATLLRKDNRIDDATAVLKEAARRAPGNADAHNDLGSIETESGRPSEAIAHFQAALTARPKFAEAFSNLAGAHFLLKQFDEAETACRDALALAPGLYQAHLNLGNVMQAKGRYEEAETSYRHALIAKPDNALAHYNLGNLLQIQERLQEAVSSYGHALALQADFIEAHNSLGNALRHLGRHDAAIASYRRALALRPNYAEAYSNLALVLQQSAPVEAEACCRKALELDPDLAEALVFLADLHANHGEFGEAEQLLRRAIAASPEMPSAWAGLVNLRTMKPEDHAWLEQALKLVAKTLPMRQETYLQFAIGKYLDDVGQCNAAFGHYRRANELCKRYTPRYDPHHEETLTARLCQIVPADLIAAQQEVNRSDKPILIVGMPRSGTSLLEQIIAAHPDVFGAGELPFWSQATSDILVKQKNGTDPDLAEYAAQYLTLLDATSGNMAYVTDKMPGNFRHLGLIHAALPNARLIHIKRNPIDTCLSIYFQFFNDAHTYANDLVDLVHYYRQYRQIMAHWRRVIAQDRLLEVDYEELVADPERWSKTILNFLGLPWDARCLDFQDNKRAIGTASNWQARQKIGRHAVERWRRYADHIGALMPLIRDDLEHPEGE